MPSTTIQPRPAKPRSALLIDARSAPTSCAISSWLSSCRTRSASPSCVPKRRASSNSWRAMRAATSLEISSTSSSSVCRSRRASTCSNRSAIAGRSAIHLRNVARSNHVARTSVIAVAVQVRAPGSNTANSPKMSVGPMIARRFTRPPRAAEADLDLARNDDVHPIAGVALGENHLARLEFGGMQLLDQCGRRRRLDTSQDCDLGQDVVHARALFFAVNPLPARCGRAAGSCRSGSRRRRPAPPSRRGCG